MRDIHSPSAGSQVTTVQRIDQGGHGGTIAEQARANLQVYGLDEINKPNGPLGLNGDGAMPIEFINKTLVSTGGIFGAKKIGLSETFIYKIVAQDSFRSYDVRAARGSVKITEAGIEYIAPKTAGQDTIYLDNTPYEIEVVDFYPRFKILSQILEQTDDQKWIISLHLDVDPSAVGVVFELSLPNGTVVSTAPYSDNPVFDISTVAGVGVSVNSFRVTSKQNDEILHSQTLTVVRNEGPVSRNWMQRLLANDIKSDNYRVTPANIIFSKDGTKLHFQANYVSSREPVPNQTTVCELSNGVFVPKWKITKSHQNKDLGPTSMSPDGLYLYDSNTEDITSIVPNQSALHRLNDDGTITLSSTYTPARSSPEHSYGVSHMGSVHKWLNDGKNLFIADPASHHNGEFTQGDLGEMHFLNAASGSISLNHSTNGFRINGRKTYSRTFPASGWEWEFLRDGAALSSGFTNIAEDEEGNVAINNPIAYWHGESPNYDNAEFWGISMIFKKESGTYSHAASVIHSRSNEEKLNIISSCALLKKTYVIILQGNLSAFHPNGRSGAPFRPDRGYIRTIKYANGYASAETRAGGVNFNFFLENYQVPLSSWWEIVKQDNERGHVYFKAHDDVANILWVFRGSLDDDAEFSDWQLLLRANYSGDEDSITLDTASRAIPRTTSIDINIERRLIAFAGRNIHYVDIFKY